MQGRFQHKLGLSLIIASCGLWVAVLFVPILPLPLGLPPPTAIAHKALLTTSLIVMSEVIFWLGILLVGKEFADRYRQKLNPYYWWQKYKKW